MIRLDKNAPLNENDKELLARLHDEYYYLLFHIAKCILNDTALVEDAVSASFIKVAQHREKFYDMKCHQEKAYIVSIIRSISINMKLQRERLNCESDEILEDITDPGVNIEADFMAKEGYDSLVMAILSLPDSLRDVAYLYFSHNMTHDEISSALGVSIDASKKRLERAKINLRKKIGGETNA